MLSPLIPSGWRVFNVPLKGEVDLLRVFSLNHQLDVLSRTTGYTLGVGFEYFLYIGVDDFVDKYLSDGLNQVVLGYE